MSRPLRFAVIGALVAFFGSAVLGLALRAALRDDDVARAERGTGLAAALDAARPAVPPFEGLTEARVGVGDRCLRVVVADEAGERVQGLRGVRDLAPYDGMLFVFPDDTDARFTMADTLIPLDIGWYDAGGLPIDRTTMEPCPDAERECPPHGASRRFRYALETAAGALGGGSLGGCG